MILVSANQDKAEGGVTETVDLTGLFAEFSILSLEVLFNLSIVNMPCWCLSLFMFIYAVVV